MALHVRNHRTQTLHGADLVDADDFLHLGVVKLVHRSQAGVQHARVVDQNVNAAKLFQRNAGQLAAVLILGDVRGNGHNGAAFCGDFRGHIVQRGLAACADDDVGALACEQHGGCGAHAGVAAGDDGGLACQIAHGKHPPFVNPNQIDGVGRRTVSHTLHPDRQGRAVREPARGCFCYFVKIVS